MKLVKYRVADGIAIVALAAPPVNAISVAVRDALADVFRRIDARDDVVAVSLTGEGATFSAGSELRDLDHLEDPPCLRDVCQQIEACRVPVIAGLHGMVLGAGADLAIAAHYRLAARGTQIAFPEVSLGLIPAGGATQRLTRLVAPEMALDLFLTGRGVDADEAKSIGLVDGVVTGSVQSATLTFAQMLVEQGKGARPTCRRPFKGGVGALMAQTSARRKLVADHPEVARSHLVDTVEAAAILPFEAGLEFEADRTDQCRKGPQSLALRRLFAAERRVPVSLIDRGADGQRNLTRQGQEITVKLLKSLVIAAEIAAADGVPEASIDAALAALGQAAHFGTGAKAKTGGPAWERLVSAMMGEGARCLERGDVARAADLDAVAVFGMNMPRWTGGPMILGQSLGLLHLRNRMRQWADFSPVWHVSPVLDQAVKFSGGFDALVKTQA